ncbi:hypothetical protein HOI18_03600 [Candidatus Uhrbacteria bacterium]|jgi:hypothetical protein|nr:hypothetical protein [Candidatus Uhrbacteria bacterium]
MGTLKKPTVLEARKIQDDPHFPSLDTPRLFGDEFDVMKQARNLYDTEGWEPNWRVVHSWIVRDAQR